MNKVIICGRLTRDIELRTTPDGVELTSFQVAVDRPTKEKSADFLPCTAWRQTAVYLSQYAHKGDRVCVDGTLQSRNYTDKDGNKRTAYDINVSRAELYGGRKNTRQPDTGWTDAPLEETTPFSTGEPAKEYEELDPLDDIPF